MPWHPVSPWSGVSRLLLGGGTRGHGVGGAELSSSDSGCSPQPNVPSRAAYQGLGFVRGTDAVTLWPRHQPPPHERIPHPETSRWPGRQAGGAFSSVQTSLVAPVRARLFPHGHAVCHQLYIHPGPSKCVLADSLVACAQRPQTGASRSEACLCVFSPSETQASETQASPRARLLPVLTRPSLCAYLWPDILL